MELTFGHLTGCIHPVQLSVDHDGHDALGTCDRLWLVWDWVHGLGERHELDHYFQARRGSLDQSWDFLCHDIFESLWYAKESFYKQYTASLILTWFGYIWTLNDLQNFVQFVDVPWITDFKKEESAVFQKWIRAKTFRSVFFHCIFCSKSQGTKNRKFKRYQKIHVKNRKVTELKNFTDVFGWYTWFG